MAIPITLETIQYNDSPLGKFRAKNPSITGIIHNIILWLDCCRESSEGMVVIFVCTQVEAATSNGMTTTERSGSAKSNHRKLSFSGAAV
jgi:hypothetical protein